MAAYPLPVTRFRAFSRAGLPLIGGKVYAYESGSTTEAKDTYSDKTKENLNTWPVILDDAGSAAIYISGDYFIRVFDADGVLVEEGDGIADPESVAQALIDGSSGGQSNLVSRVEDLESFEAEATDDINELKDSTTDLDERVTAEVNTNRNTAITAAINTLKAEIAEDFQDLRTEYDLKVQALRIPVGGLYLSTSTENPSGTLNYGTWDLHGQGRALVGYSSVASDPAWTKTVGDTFGDYDRTLTAAQIPQLSATYHRFTGNTTGDHSVTNIDGNGLLRYANNETLTINSGGGAAHSIVQPSIVVMVWKRTA